MTPDELSAALAKTIDGTLASQLIEEAISLEEAFLLRRWKYTELDGGRFAEVAARIIYSVDSGNVSLTRSVDDCLRYIDNDKVPHKFPETQTAIHIAKVIRAIYKLRSQRGAVHVSPKYTANEIDSRLIVESVRWILAEILRVFVTGDREEVATAIQALARFPNPLIRTYADLPLLQSTAFTTEEEILAHLLNSERGLTVAELISIIPKDQSTVRRAAKKLCGSQLRQVVERSRHLIITDLGTKRIEKRIAEEVG
jgi:hypothetical protein